MWFFWSLGNALAESIKDVFGKHGAQKFDEYLAAFSQRFFALFLLIPLAFIFGNAKPDAIFWYATFGSVAINIITSILYFRALKESPLSLVLPIVTLSPIFLLFTSPLINREVPSLFGVAGVIVSVFGTYLLNISKRKEGLFAPLKTIWSNQGTRFMLIVAFLWSISAPFDKVAVQHANPMLKTGDPYFYVAISHIFLALALLPFVIKKIKPSRLFAPTSARVLAPIGIVSGLAITFQMIAFSMTLVPYAISVKRTSALFGALWGKLFFKEVNLKERLVGAVVILVGAAMVLFSAL